MADSLSTFISMANYRMPGRIRRNCSTSFQLQIKSRFRLTLRRARLTRSTSRTFAYRLRNLSGDILHTAQ